MRNPFLVGKRIYLRPLDPEDVKRGYLDWINDRRTNRFLMAGIMPTNEGELSGYYEKITCSKNDIMFAIVMKKTDKYIGNIKLGGIDWINRHAHCGRLIGDSKSRGKGYGTEALKLVIGYAFNTLNLNRVYNSMIIDNMGAMKSCIKAGMKKEGRFSQYRFLDGRYRDVLQFAITRSRYERLKKERR